MLAIVILIRVARCVRICHLPNVCRWRIANGRWRKLFSNTRDINWFFTKDLFALQRQFRLDSRMLTVTVSRIPEGLVNRSRQPRSEEGDKEEIFMLKASAAILICRWVICTFMICTFTICLSSLSAFSQSKSDYQAGTIMAVAPHPLAPNQVAAAPEDSPASYDVSVKVGDIVYVVLYTPPLGQKTVEYAAGRDLLVLVKEKTVVFNDPFGNSREIPILSRTTTTTATTTTAPTQSHSTADLPQAQIPITQTPIKSVELIGLAGIKDNTQGILTIGDGKLRFAHSTKTAEIVATAMEEVITGTESQRVIRGTVGTLSLFGPYGSGRVLSLFRSNLDSLTIRYRDADGGLHGVVFGVPVGQAEPIKKELLAEGAHTSVPAQAGPSADSSKPAAMEEKQ